MILILHTGPRSAPVTILRDSTGISIDPVGPLAIPYARPTGAPSPSYPSTYGSALRWEPAPNALQACYQEGRDPGPDGYAARLAEWEAGLAAAIVEWEAACAEFADRHYHNSVVWHGARYYLEADGATGDNATCVHETVEEIAAALRDIPR